MSKKKQKISIPEIFSLLMNLLNAKKESCDGL
jgi:hypothetical protein